jgi:hypothetical protein
MLNINITDPIEIGAAGGTRTHDGDGKSLRIKSPVLSLLRSRLHLKMEPPERLALSYEVYRTPTSLSMFRRHIEILRV